MPSLHIRTTPPGPRARMLLRRYERHVAPSATQSYPLVVDHAAGCHVWDVDGNCYLDFTAGISVSAVGHSHKQVVGAITAQVDRLIHFSFADFFYPSYVRMAERLAELAPGRGPKQVFLCNSGAEAIEAAIKLVRHATRRSEEHTSELQSRLHLVCRLLLEKKKNTAPMLSATGTS